MEAGALAGLTVVVATPEGYEPDPTVTAEAQALAREHGGAVELVRDPREAVRGAHAVYADVWLSMGDPEEEKAARFAALEPYRITRRAGRRARRRRHRPALPAGAPRRGDRRGRHRRPAQRRLRPGREPALDRRRPCWRRWCAASSPAAREPGSGAAAGAAVRHGALGGALQVLAVLVAHERAEGADRHGRSGVELHPGMMRDRDRYASPPSVAPAGRASPAPMLRAVAEDKGTAVVGTDAERSCADVTTGEARYLMALLDLEGAATSRSPRPTSRAASASRARRPTRWCGGCARSASWRAAPCSSRPAGPQRRDRPALAPQRRARPAARRARDGRGARRRGGRVARRERLAAARPPPRHLARAHRRGRRSRG